ncbi:MAG: phosphatase family [Lasallia pustulata]|uniref:Phosphatase family n=1 Tax=Lasallia pustulata TaxID=136370 RepID=A0A5M8PRQ2_9LECA|nr:MAG: phosphatase family [Lasallia pustulata]
MRGEGGDEKPPWEEGLGWPFVEGGWRWERGKEREGLKTRVREALDTDQAFDTTWTPDVPALWRLEVLAETLLEFLTSLEDGVVPEHLWAGLEAAIIEREKTKSTLSADEERAVILDSLASSPPHSVAFTFLTFMLARVANEVAPLASEPSKSQPKATGRARARTRSHDPARLRRRQVEQSLAALFAGVVVRAPMVGGRERERRASEGRRMRVVEVFLVGKGVG